VSAVPRRLPRPALLPRKAARLDRPRVERIISPSCPPDPAFARFQTDPHVDYGRFLTDEGGVLIIYKDLDLRFRHTLWRLFAWTASTGIAGWLLYHHSPVQSAWINIAALLTLAVINWFIVAKPIELYRRVEIRPDCMILEGSDVFWLHLMECGWPAFQPDDDGNQVLSGIYGSRFVEYLTARRFDEEDRMPEVFAAHLQDAMNQLWATALATGTAQSGSAARHR